MMSNGTGESITLFRPVGAEELELVDNLAGKTRQVPARVLFGAAFHDIYHAGQIRLLRRLQGGES